MTGTPTDASPECGHPANELLDFYVNGSLEGDEASMVAAHVAACAACARDVHELQSLSEALEAHGVAPASAWRGGRLLWGLGTAAAVLGGIIIVRLGPSESRVASVPPGNGTPAAVDSAGAAPSGVEKMLDLGGGPMRDAGAGLPRVELEPGVSVLRLTLTHPVPGTELRFGVRGPGDEETVADQALPPHDAMGRVEIPVPASRFATSGTYQVVLKPATPGGEAGPYYYSFEVRISSDRS